MESQYEETQAAYTSLGSLLKVLLACATVLLVFGCVIGFGLTMIMTILAEMIK